MEVCPKLDSCHKVQMILDKDLTFDWLYAAEIKKVCELCNSSAKNSSTHNRKKKKVVLTYG
jgi:hypothetical protein